MDGQEVTLPFTSAELSVHQASSTFLLLQTFGAHVLWGLETPVAYITLQPTFAGKVRPWAPAVPCRAALRCHSRVLAGPVLSCLPPCQVRGLCGTYNWDQQDEFTTPAGDVETGIAAFANKYRASGNCPATLGTIPIESCDGFAGRREVAEAACAILHGPAFQVPSGCGAS